MSTLVQSAIEAAQQGDRTKAVDLLKQELSENPNSIEALLAMVTMVDEPTRKRQLLNRVLSLDATNKVARETMLELDRAEINAYRTQPIAFTVSKTQSQPQPSAANADLPVSKPIPTVTEKPMVFRYSVGWLAVMYVFTVVFCCLGLLLASQSISSATPPLVFALLFGLTSLSVSSKVEVKNTGIRTASLFSSAEIAWNDIASIKSNSMKRRLELISNTGKSVNVSSQVKGYGAIVEILRQKRPDLFAGTASAPVQQSVSFMNVEQSPSVLPTPPVSTLSFTESKTFEKSFFGVYGLLFVLVPLLFLFVWLAITSPENRTGFLVVAGVCVLFMLIPFLQVSSLKVEPNKLIVGTFFEEKELTARDIKEIKMAAVRGRYGRVTNFVYIIPKEGKKYPVAGFAEGDEIIYGYLMNWWNTYLSR